MDGSDDAATTIPSGRRGFQTLLTYTATQRDNETLRVSAHSNTRPQTAHVHTFMMSFMHQALCRDRLETTQCA